MKKLLLNRKQFLQTSIICLVAFGLLSGCVIYLAARPISYNMAYYGVREDEYGRFASKNVYTYDKFRIIKNINYDLPVVDFYYYKDGYVFGLRAETNEQYEMETAKINDRWEDALKVDFYSSKINPYKMIDVRPDGAETIYFCREAIVLSVVAAVGALGIAGLYCTFFVRYQKSKRIEQTADE